MGVLTIMFMSDVALERLRYQGNDLCTAVATIISRLRDAVANEDAREEVKCGDDLAELILKRTGIGLDVEISPDKEPNAWVWIRDDAKFYRHTYNPTNMEEITKKFPREVEEMRKTINTWVNGEPVAYTVDYVKGYIDFKDKRLAKHLHSCAITHGLIKLDSITDYEVAAILLHELGHVFHYYAMCGILHHTSYVMHVALESRAGGVLEKDRITLVTNACKSVDLPTDYVGAMCEVKTPAGAITMIDITSKAKMQSILKLKEYNARFEEYMADNFAMMHGAGSAIATGLRKMRESATGPFYFVANRGNKGRGMTALFFALELAFMYFIFNTFVVVMTLGGAVGLLAQWLAAPMLMSIIAVTLLGSLGDDTTYDRNFERIKSMRRSLIQSLRTVESKEYAAKIIDELDTLIDFMSTNVSTRYTSAFAIPAEIYARASGKNRAMDFIRELEDAVGNELHVESKRLELLA